MDPLSIALVGALLGGVSGALVGGYVSLLTQRRQFAEQREARFVDVRRERYARMLRLVDEWIRAYYAQLDAAEKGDEPLPHLPPTEPLESLANEIELVGPMTWATPPPDWSWRSGGSRGSTCCGPTSTEATSAGSAPTTRHRRSTQRGGTVS
ncbi:MAG: hypothetical protein ACYDAN_13000 [Candidatus Limnocylindrales bacterium]